MLTGRSRSRATPRRKSSRRCSCASRTRPLPTDLNPRSSSCCAAASRSIRSGVAGDRRRARGDRGDRRRAADGAVSGGAGAAVAAAVAPRDAGCNIRAHCRRARGGGRRVDAQTRARLAGRPVGVHGASSASRSARWRISSPSPGGIRVLLTAARSPRSIRDLQPTPLAGHRGPRKA